MTTELESSRLATPKVDFYVCKDKTPQFTLRTICRVVEKGLTAGHRIHVLLRSADDCENLDSLLWTYRDRSFIPHEISNAPIEHCPLTISAENSDKMDVNHSDMLVNVMYEVPDNFMQFQRIAEIIDIQVESIRAGRERYRFYRENGLEPQHHEVS